MRQFLLCLSGFGVALFGSILVLSFVRPISIERVAREVVRIEVERKVGEKVDALSNSQVTVLAQRALGRTQEQIEVAQRSLRDELPRKVANTLADMLDADCECRKRLTAYAAQVHTERLSSLNQVRERLTNLIESSYSSVTASLMRELRIFATSNAAAFALLGLITYFRRSATLQLLLPALALIGAVVVTGGLYVFNQNWLHTVIYGQYVGLAYSGYLLAVALLFADILLNRARVTTQLLNLSAQLVGSTVKAVPC